jgi:rhamnosyltransferase
MDKTNEILAVIVTYNPDEVLLERNLKSLAKQVKSILIVDNASINRDRIYQIAKQFNVTINQNETNLGIAEALQIGLNRAIDQNNKYLLTMDQDSVFNDSKSVDNLLAKFFEFDKVGISAPTPSYENKTNYEQPITTPLVVITSGALCSIKALQEIGGFNTKLFIDGVDYDVCFRLAQRGYKVIQDYSNVLEHNLGYPTSLTLFGRKITALNYSEIRLFYIARNYYYLARKYPQFKETTQGLLRFIRKMKMKIILLEKHKLRKLVCLRRGKKASKQFYKDNYL